MHTCRRKTPWSQTLSFRQIFRLTLFHKLYHHVTLCDELIPQPLYFSSCIHHRHKVGFHLSNTKAFYQSFWPLTSREWNHLVSYITLWNVPKTSMCYRSWQNYSLVYKMAGEVKWQVVYKMAGEIRISKCYHVQFTNKKNKVGCSFLLQDCKIQTVDTVKYLGVTLTETLNWNAHIDAITSKAYRLLYFQRNFKDAPQITKRNTLSHKYKTCARIHMHSMGPLHSNITRQARARTKASCSLCN